MRAQVEESSVVDNDDPPGTRTWNLRLRRPTPYPVGQQALDSPISGRGRSRSQRLEIVIASGRRSAPAQPPSAAARFAADSSSANGFVCGDSDGSRIWRRGMLRRHSPRSEKNGTALAPGKADPMSSERRTGAPSSMLSGSQTVDHFSVVRVACCLATINKGRE
jgi:hypothetical protein